MEPNVCRLTVLDLLILLHRCRGSDVILTRVPQGKHGIHIHVFGDFTEGLMAAGGIFNPFGRNHGSPDDEERMVGDLGNFTS